MKTNEPNESIPPITEIPDYVWSRRYDTPSFVPGRPSGKPKDIGRQIHHLDAESALRAAKKACREKSTRWFGRAAEGSRQIAFCVYEDTKVVERHVVDR